MNIKQLIFGRKKEKGEAYTSSITNPYVKGAEGRAEWNDRYMNMTKMIRFWQSAFFSSIVIIIILAMIVGKIATESRVQPFVVETTNGMPYAVKAMSDMSIHDQKLINFALNQFIMNARTVINDAEAEKTLLNKLYAYTANNAINFFHEYYQKNNPFELASQYSVTVNIVNALPISKDTWQVTWDETKHSTTGGTLLDTSRWVANLTYKFGEINSHFVSENPFGFYITDISWSQSQSK
ncbi:hypothetical protein AYO45_01960 [Gammaproteobacteria bacterium SCGC AG-212-F23]|nr:hypothetical protein AYO45_01960 [Gammaproteobacteria bacterium SCGC AG-212-F23]